VTARTTTKSKAKTESKDEPDLLAGLADDVPAGDDEDFDLLDSLTEDNGTPWYPWEEEDQPKGIQGTVTYVGQVDSDYGDKEPVPYIELRTKAGEEWSIRGYGFVLQNQIEKTDPQVGDLFAVKYLGEKTGRKSGNDYHNFKAVVRHAA
jgi:hypothetical protein